MRHPMLQCEREKWAYLGARKTEKQADSRSDCTERDLRCRIQPYWSAPLWQLLGTSGELCPGNWQPKVCVSVCVRWKWGWEVDRPCRLVFFVVFCYNWDFWRVYARLWASVRGCCAIKVFVWQLDNTLSAVCHSRSTLPQEAGLREHTMWRRKQTDPWHEDQ